MELLLVLLVTFLASIYCIQSTIAIPITIPFNIRLFIVMLCIMIIYGNDRWIDDELNDDQWDEWIMYDGDHDRDVECDGIDDEMDQREGGGCDDQCQCDP